MNKHQLVKEHLLEHGSITSWEAIQQYGATRLASIICNLRKQGYDIRTIMREETDRFGNTCQYANYVLRGEEE